MGHVASNFLKSAAKSREALSKIAWTLFPSAASAIRTRKGRKLDAAYGDLSPQEAFSQIYAKALWGRRDEGLGSSGGGSHDTTVVDPYLSAIAAFVETLPPPVTLVDLGCGDLAVGRQLIALVDRYVGCDVVPALIAEHRRHHGGPEVQFACIDIIRDELPAGDVATIRQVLQHLSNDQIRSLLPKLVRYKHVIVTEHVPLGSFRPNADKSMGPGTRLSDASGVVLGEPPFELATFSIRPLCTVAADGGVIKTILYSRRD